MRKLILITALALLTSTVKAQTIKIELSQDAALRLEQLTHSAKRSVLYSKMPSKTAQLIVARMDSIMVLLRDAIVVPDTVRQKQPLKKP
jgi:hypothetical protein